MLKEFLWMKDAACKDQTQTFFPGVFNDNHCTARKICAACTVRSDCDSYARWLLTVDEPISKGLWAGLTIEELRHGLPEKPPPPEKVVRPLPECANPECKEIVPPNRNGRGKPRRFCCERCKRRGEYLRNH